MANLDHQAFLMDCIEAGDDGSILWNTWRNKNNIRNIDLSGIDLTGANMLGYNFTRTDFSYSNLSHAHLIECILTLANFNNSILIGADLSLTQGGETNFKASNMMHVKAQHAILIKSDFSEANLEHSDFLNASIGSSDFTDSNLFRSVLLTTNLVGSNLTRCNLQQCQLAGANLSNSNLTEANISGSGVFGISAWNINSTNLVQKDLIITNDWDPVKLTIDDIEVAQFVYLLSNNANLSRVIDTITSKSVLILGRFTEDRKEVLDSIKLELRKYGYVSIVFDFERPISRDLTETVGLLGRMSKFIIADLTDAKSIPQELSELIPGNPSLVIMPILQKGSPEYGMFEHWKKYPWVLEIYEYESANSVIQEIKIAIIDPVDNYLDKNK